MSIPKYKYAMDYIADKNTYKAVMFACQMIREGRGPGVACRIAAHYYGVDQQDVHHYVSQRGGRRRAEG